MTDPIDIAVELGRTDPPEGSPELAQWHQWIEATRHRISKGDGDHPGLGNLAALDQETLDYVVRMAVAAHVRKPDAATTVEVAVDDARTSRTYTSGRGEVEIQDRWWRMLGSPTKRRRAYTIDTVSVT